MLDDKEWYSICCTANPMGNIRVDDGIDPMGICSNCRDNTTFYEYNHESN